MNVLVAVDSSAVCTQVVQRVAKWVAPQGEGAQVTLLHVVESLPEYIVSRSSGTSATLQHVAEEWAGHNRKAGEALLAERKQALVAGGIPASAVQTKLIVKEGLPEAQRVLAAAAIIEEMKNGGYDVVAIGRRSSHASDCVFLGGVADKVIREAQGRTVWVIDA